MDTHTSFLLCPAQHSRSRSRIRLPALETGRVDQDMTASIAHHHQPHVYYPIIGESRTRVFLWPYTDLYKWTILSQKGKLALQLTVFTSEDYAKRTEFIFRTRNAPRCVFFGGYILFCGVCVGGNPMSVVRLNWIGILGLNKNLLFYYWIHPSTQLSHRPTLL